MNFSEPIRFNPVYMTYLWGGRRMVDVYGRGDAPAKGPVAESWEVSDRPDGMSLAAGGACAGSSLRELIEANAAGILGSSSHRGVFPLLIKIIDAAQALSVQVHPDDESAARGLGEAKSEAWYILDAKPGAYIYRGFKAGVTLEDFDASLKTGTVEELLVRCPVTSGDLIYIPGGTVHAIGEGCLILEVQQNSNTTYRVYDWNRKGPDGKTRALHLDEARKVIHWQSDEVHQPADDGRCSTPYFTIECTTLGKRALNVVDPLKGFTVVFVEEGSVVFQFDGREVPAVAGTTWLLPASLRKCRLARATPTEPARVVVIRGKPAA